MSNPESTTNEEQEFAKRLKSWGLYRAATREAIRDRLMGQSPYNLEQSLSNESHNDEVLEEAIRDILGIDLKSMPAAQIDHILNLHGLTIDEAKVIARRAIRFRQWSRQLFENAKESLFIKHKQSLTYATYTILRTRSQALCEELYCRLVAKESTLEELATCYSEGEEASRNGKLGPVAIEEMGPIVKRILEVSQPGQLWPPKEIEGWWVVLRLDERKDAEMTEETMDEIYRRESEQLIDAEFLKKSHGTR